MSETTASPASPGKILTPPRPCVAAKPASVPPAPASRPVAAAPVEAQVPKADPSAASLFKTAFAPPPLPAKAVAPIAPVTPIAPVKAELAVAPPAPLASVPAKTEAAVPPAAPSSGRRSLLSIVTWDAFRPEPDPLALAKMTPAVMMRRARLTKIVKGVVAGCAGLCLIALVRVAAASASEVEDPMHTGTSAHKVHEAKVLVVADEERTIARTPSFAAKASSLRHH